MKKKKSLSIIMTLFMLFTNVLNPNVIQTIFAEDEQEADVEAVSEDSEKETREADKEDEDKDEEDKKDDKSSETNTNKDNEDDDDNDGDVEQKEDKKEADSEKEKEETPAKEDTKSEDKETEDNKDPPIQTFADEGKDLGNIFTDIQLTLDGNNIEDGNTIEIEDGTELGMLFDWEIADDVDLNKDDYATIDIPNVFDTEKLPNGNLEDEDGTAVGTFTFEDGQLKVVFNDELTDKENRKGSVGFNIEFDLSEFDDEIEKEIEFGEPINKIFKVKVKVDGEDIQKTGQLEEGANPKSIDWSIDVNTNLDSLTNAIVKDDTPEGLELDFDSIEVYELSVDRHGNVTEGDKTDNPNVVETDSGFKVDLGDTSEAYRIKHTTNIADYDVDGYTNTAILEVDGEDKAEDDHRIGKVERESYLEKYGYIDENPKNVTWTLEVNKAEENLTNVSIKDEIPEGLELNGIEVFELNYVDGKWTQGAEVSGDYDSFPLEFDEIDRAYRVIIDTKIDFDHFDSIADLKEGIEYTNEATLTADGDIEDDDEDSVKAEWDDFVAKTGKDVTDYGDREMEWTVTLNKAMLEINDAKFIDIVGSGQELIEDSVKVDGEEASDVKYDNFNDWNLALPDGVNIDDITFGIDLGDIKEEVKISYRTKITDTSIKEYTNKALLFGWLGKDGVDGEDNPYIEDHDTGGKLTIKNEFLKRAGDINYEEKTMDWTVIASSKAEAFEELVITDSFDPKEGMVLLPDTIEVKDKDGDTPEFDIESDNFGYTITIDPDGFEKRTKYTITFQTSFDPNKVLDAEGTLNDSKVYKNEVNFKGKNSEEKFDTDRDAKQTIEDWHANYGEKKGKLDRENRTVAWEIYTNALGRDLSGEEFKVEDELTEGQVFDKNSFKVYEYTLKEDGTVNKGDEIEGGFNLEETDDGFTVIFANGIDKPVMFEFDSDIEGISEEKYTNTADVTGKDLEQTYDDTVKYKNYDKFVDKNSDIDGDTAYTDNEINWNVTVNDSLSDITDAVFKDEISSGQILINDSIKVDGEEVDEDNLTIDLSEDGTTIEIKLGDTASTHEITYTTVVTASEGNVSNKASLTGSDKELGDSSDKEYDAKSSSWGTGSGNEKRGSIEITKVKEDGGDTIKLPTEFELYYEINGEKQVVTGDTQVTEDGKVQYGNLPFRTYYLVEKDAPTGYEEDNEPVEIEVNGDNRNITIDFENEKIKREVSGEKTWKDHDASDRPEEIEVELTRESDGKEDKEFLETRDIKPTKPGKWKYEFTNLDKYDDVGNEYDYIINELNVSDKYESKVDGHDIINTRIGKIDIPVKKRWIDEDDKDRPDSITVELYRNGVKNGKKEIKPTVNGSWKYIFTNLDEFDEDGQPYKYTVKEKSVDGYKSVIEGHDIKNIRSEETSIEIQKNWLDDNSSERPKEITVYLRQNGKSFHTITLKAENDWKYEYTGLDAFDDEGKPYTYTIEEKIIDGYKSNVEEYTITNLRVGKVDVQGEKHWDEVDDRYRPESIKVQLLANDEEKETIEISEKEEWKYEFTDLEEFDDQGKKIEYAVKELNVPKGYESEIEDFIITNTQEKTEVIGEKKWDEVDDRYRPDTVEIQLFANGEKEQTIKTSNEDDWKYEFTDLAKYDKDGKEITYTVEEIDVSAGYDSKVDGSDIINTQKSTEVSGQKHWNEVDDRYRPDTVEIQLFANGEKEQTIRDFK